MENEIVDVGSESIRTRLGAHEDRDSQSRRRDEKGHRRRAQEAPGRPRLVDQGGEGEPRLTLRVSCEHDDRLRHRRLSRSSPHDDDLRRRESSSLAHQGCSKLTRRRSPDLGHAGRGHRRHAGIPAARRRCLFPAAEERALVQRVALLYSPVAKDAESLARRQVAAW